MSLLHLRAHDADDLKAIAAVTQDALAPVADMAWLENERRFVLAMNRFRWETALAVTDDVYERVNCGLCFEGVTRVETRGIDLKARDAILDLLTVIVADKGIVLSFADGRDVRLTAETLDCRLDDFGEPWPTRSMPSHITAAEWRNWKSES